MYDCTNVFHNPLIQHNFYKKKKKKESLILRESFVIK